MCQVTYQMTAPFDDITAPSWPMYPSGGGKGQDTTIERQQSAIETDDPFEGVNVDAEANRFAGSRDRDGVVRKRW